MGTINDAEYAYYSAALGVDIGSIQDLRLAFFQAGIQFATKGTLALNAGDTPYNAKADAVTDATSALNTAAADAKAQKRVLYIPAGTYKINGSLLFECSVYAPDVIFKYYGSAVCLTAGSTATNTVVFQKDMHLPRVEHTNANWDGTSTGILLANLNTCRVYVPGIRDFEFGLKVWGYNQGIAYNTIFMGYTQQCRKMLSLSNDATGWSNQNTLIGGRWGLVLGKGSAVGDSGAYFLSLVQNGSASGANNNSFYTCSFEGDLYTQYSVILDGARYNVFHNCRWETNNTTPPGHKITYLNDSRSNRIEGGYDAWKIQETFDATSTGGSISDNTGACRGGLTALSIPNNTFTAITTWTPSGMSRITYDGGTGKFTPRPGKWLITASVTFAADPTATGVRRISMSVQPTGTQRVVEVAAGSATTKVTVVLSETFMFDNINTTFSIAAYQNSGGALALDTTAGYSRITCDYIRG